MQMLPAYDFLQNQTMIRSATSSLFDNNESYHATNSRITLSSAAVLRR